MPVSPALAENLAQTVVGLYSQAEQGLIARIARNLAKGIDGPQWAQDKLAQMQAYERQAAALLTDLQRRAATGAETAITTAYERGGLSAVADLARMNVSVVEPLAGLRAADALAQETIGYLSATGPRILRTTMDTYRSVVAESSQQVLLGTQTMRTACQDALNRFAVRGIAAFPDRAGRVWRLESYVEAAMRTGCGHAAVQGHTDRLQVNGLDLVIGSDAPKECPRCSPWEGRVMSISGSTPGYPTLAEARAGGWQHVNCRHSISAYQEGITQPMHDTEDPQGYKDAERLRELERRVRAAKRVELVAMDESARRLAAAKVRMRQAAIREHVAKTGAKRLPYREQIGKAI